MNKKEFIAAVTEKSNLTALQAEAAVAATFDTLQAIMVKDDSIMIAGFGKFATKIRPGRKGRNPSTGQEMVIPKAIVPVFKPSTQLKESVNTIKEDGK